MKKSVVNNCAPEIRTRICHKRDPVLWSKHVFKIKVDGFVSALFSVKVNGNNWQPYLEQRRYHNTIQA